MYQEPHVGAMMLKSLLRSHSFAVHISAEDAVSGTGQRRAMLLMGTKQHTDLQLFLTLL